MTRTPYHITAIISAWALATYTLAFAAWGAPWQMPGRESIWWVFPVIYALLAVAAYYLADLIEDFQRQLDLREKFALFLAHVFIVFAHIPLLRGFWLAWGLGMLLMPLLLFLQRELNFNRLALACGLLWMARLARRPDDPPWWTLGFAALMLLTLIASHYFTTYRRYDVERGESPEYFWRIGGFWVAGVVVLGGVAWLLVPRLTPVEFRAAPAAPGANPFEGTNRPAFDFPFFLEVLIWSSAVFGLLYAIYWIRSKYRGGEQAPFELARSTLQRVKEEVERKVVNPWRANLMQPADRVIFYYNMFCNAMGRFDLARRPSMTPLEYRGFLVANSSTSRRRRDDLDYITELFQQALYGADEITSVDSRHFQRLAQDIINVHEKPHAPMTDSLESENQD